MILSCLSCLYILETNCFSGASFANIFPQSEIVFCFLYDFFCCVKAFEFSQVPCINFCFNSYYLGSGLKKILWWFVSKSVLFIFSSKSFIVSSLTFRSLIHFEFIFVYGVRECFKFVLLHLAVQFLQHHLLKKLSSLHFIFLPSLSHIR